MSDSGQDVLGLQLVFHLQESMGGAGDMCSGVSGTDSPGQHFLEPLLPWSIVLSRSLKSMSSLLNLAQLLPPRFSPPVHCGFEIMCMVLLGPALDLRPDLLNRKSPTRLF